MCTQPRLRSAWASAQSDHSLRCPHEESLGPYPLSTQWRLWAVWADAQADPSLRWAHGHFVGFINKLITKKSLMRYRLWNASDLFFFLQFLFSAQIDHFIHGEWFIQLTLTSHMITLSCPILVSWTSPFLNLEVYGVLFHFYFISNRNSWQQIVQTLIRHCVLWHLIWVYS